MRFLFDAALMAAALLTVPGAVGGSVSGPVVPDVPAFDAMLKRYVLDNGAVRYAEWKKDLGPLARFVGQIGAVSPDAHPALFPTRAHRLAYWINTYNALVLWAMASEYPEKKDRLSRLVGRAQFFYLKRFLVGGKSRTLDDIETNPIRKGFGEPRIHFAIVCASAGCPWLARDAFTAGNLETLLDRRARLFVNQERNVRIDARRREVTLSKIFDWYRKDFGPVLEFVAKYREKDAAQLRQGRWTLRFFEYDWTINDAR